MLTRISTKPWVRAAAITASISAAAAVAVGMASTATAANVTGTMLVQNVTHPGDGVWLPGPAGTPGHYWTPDGVLGFCRVNVGTTTPPGTTSNCTGTAKAGMQAVYDAVNQKVYVADGASKSINVVRFDYSPTNENVSNGVAIPVNNPTAIGGGSGAGRPSSIALSPDGTKLYVGYIRSGDVMVVSNPATYRAGTTPTVAKAGSTSDGRGVAGFALVRHSDAAGVQHDDLYMAETGGLGLSVITDIDGTGGHPACGSPTACQPTTSHNSSGAVTDLSPGALAFDGTLLYIGHSPANQPASVERFNPTTLAEDTLSTDITPSYTSTVDNLVHTQYIGITGLAVAPNGDVIVGDDPGVFLATPPLNVGHIWKIAAAATTPVITAISPNTGPTTGGTSVTITGTNLVNAVAGPSSVKFGTLTADPATTTCAADGTSCVAVSPAVPATGVVDVRVTNGDGQTSAAVAADQFTYATATTPPPTGPSITTISPTSGLATGGTVVTITGVNLVSADGTAAVHFGTVTAASAACTPDGITCTAVSPAGTAGQTVDVQVVTAQGTSPAVAADRFTYVTPVGQLYSYGITAPKGGVTWVPGALGGHFWVSDHSNGLCRLDAVAGSTTLHAINPAVCDPGFTIGSPGQMVYDPATNADGTHYLFVPDNAVKSPGVWRLTFDPATETLTSNLTTNPPVSMAPGGQLAGLKANALALVGHDLYVGDLVDGNIRRINNVDGDPLLQTVDIVAQTQAQKVNSTAVGRGINGTMAVVGTKVFLPENNAATYFDTTAPCAAKGTTTPCATTAVSFLGNTAPVFVAGIAADNTNKLVYISYSTGGNTEVVYRVDATTITAAAPGGAPGVVYASNGIAPTTSPETINQCSITCTRPADLTPGAPVPFQFAQGVYVDPNTSDLYVTEDASAGARANRGHVWKVPFVP